MFVKLLVCLGLLRIANGDYWSDRKNLIALEKARMIGSGFVFSDMELTVNNYLMEKKHQEYNNGYANPGSFLPNIHFFEARGAIEQSEVYKFLQKLPKGAVLHSHTTGLLSFDELYNLTYEENLYACTVNDRLSLKFMSTPVEDLECQWRLVRDLRQENSFYDAWLKSQITLVTSNPKLKYPNINVVWGEFANIFDTVRPLLTYRPVLEKYFYQALHELHEDNVLYLEFRSTLSTVYDLNGTTYDKIAVAGIYKNLIDRYKQDYPDFVGARLIFAPSRNVDQATVSRYVQIVNQLDTQYPGFLAGFDLVGQEDKGKPLSQFISQIQAVSSSINFLYHAGETNWYGTSTDFNMVDAILLGTKRIGHGYALLKHPTLMALVKERKIAIEVSPISNQVLMLVEDMRNHPAAHLIADGYPVVICNDDPTFWGSKGLSYDFYMAFMGIAGRYADLKLLKGLAENSILYSTLTVDEKELALLKWSDQWNAFINNTYNLIRSGAVNF